MIECMNKATIINEVIKGTGYPKKVVTDIVNRHYEVIEEALANGEDRVTISGFGSYRSRLVPAKKMVSHLNDGKTIPVAATSKIIFRPSELLKSRLTKALSSRGKKTRKS